MPGKAWHRHWLVSTKQDKIIAARKKLRERFLAKKAKGLPVKSGEEAAADQNAAPINRHGQPKLPPGQTQSKKWPVLDLGVLPKITKEEWSLELRGLCQNAHTMRWSDLMAFDQVEEASDFHCVTAWSRMDLIFGGVRLIDIVAAAEIDASATHIMCYGLDGYCTNLSLEAALQSDVILAYRAEGEPLQAAHGGPVRMITPRLYAWKGAKWICAIEFMAENRPGFWEKNGYSMGANPWLEDRYS